METEIKKYLFDINESIDSIEKYLGGKRDFNIYLADKMLRRAVEREFEIIGEATKKIPVDFKLKWYSINWKNMAGMRDRLIHDYMGVNYSIVWDVAKNKIPELSLQIQKVIQTEESGQ